MYDILFGLYINSIIKYTHMKYKNNCLKGFGRINVIKIIIKR